MQFHTGIYVDVLNGNLPLSRDRLRTTSNVLSDCYGAAFVEKWSKNDLDKLQKLGEQPIFADRVKMETYRAVGGDNACPVDLEYIDSDRLE